MYVRFAGQIEGGADKGKPRIDLSKAIDDFATAQKQNRPELFVEIDLSVVRRKRSTSFLMLQVQSLGLRPTSFNQLTARSS
ncbi:MAG: hypothetical protein DCO98_07200 [Altererythrobacter sp. XM-24bin4]|nr:MAG: hypothetical protein DCO98_07200 [Altererythrobacter sp. XM-24bin4]